MSLENAQDELVWYKRVEDDVIHIYLNDPSRLNAMGAGMAEIMPLIYSEVEDFKPSLVVLRGSGDCFSAGGDLEFLKARLHASIEENRSTMLAYYKAFLGVRRLSAMSVAVMNRAAIGAGLCLAMACDTRMIHPSCKVALNFLSLGISPGMGALPLGSAVMGHARAYQMLSEAHRVQGRQFFDWGAAQSLFETSEQLESLLTELAQQARQVSTRARLRLREEEDDLLGLEKCLQIEAAAQADCFSSPQFRQKMDEI